MLAIVGALTVPIVAGVMSRTQVDDTPAVPPTDKMPVPGMIPDGIPGGGNTGPFLPGPPAGGGSSNGDNGDNSGGASTGQVALGAEHGLEAQTAAMHNMVKQQYASNKAKLEAHAKEVAPQVTLRADPNFYSDRDKATALAQRANAARRVVSVMGDDTPDHVRALAHGPTWVNTLGAQSRARQAGPRNSNLDLPPPALTQTNGNAHLVKSVFGRLAPEDLYKPTHQIPANMPASIFTTTLSNAQGQGFRAYPLNRPPHYTGEAY